MAWKRGTQNNQAGMIRKGQIKEFLAPTSREVSISHSFTILDQLSIHSEHFQSICRDGPLAYLNFVHLPEDMQSFVNADTGVIYLHAHDHPSSVLTCVSHEDIPAGCIALSDVQRANSKVCTSPFLGI